MQRHVARGGTRDDYVRAVIFVKGLEDNDFVAWVDNGEQARDHPFGRTAGNRDIEIRVAVQMIVGAGFLRDRAAEIGRAVRDRVLIVVLVDRTFGGILELRGSRKVRKSLGQIDGATSQRTPRHFTNYRFGKEMRLVRNISRHRALSLAFRALTTKNL